MFLAVGTMAAMGLTVIGFIIDLILKYSKGIRLTGFIFLFFLTATIASLTTIELSRSRAEKQGNKVIRAAYQYKSKHGHFPTDIESLDMDNQLKAKFAKRNVYSTDSTKSQFELEVHSDGWHSTVFRSRDSIWVTED